MMEFWMYYGSLFIYASALKLWVCYPLTTCNHNSLPLCKVCYSRMMVLSNYLFPLIMLVLNISYLMYFYTTDFLLIKITWSACNQVCYNNRDFIATLKAQSSPTLLMLRAAFNDLYFGDIKYFLNQSCQIGKQTYHK